MKELQAGANITLNDLDEWTIAVSWAPEKIQGCDVDVSAFLLGPNGKVRSDRDFIFYNFPKTSDGSIRFEDSDNASKFFIQLPKISKDVDKIAFAVTIHGDTDFTHATSLSIQVGQTARFASAITQMSERALIIGELYRRNESWKFRAIGQGFKGGLEPLATHFGIVVDEPVAAPIPPPQAHPKVAPAPAPAPPLSPKKINLGKNGDKTSISLKKESHVTARLKWDTKADLDLYCFYVDTDDKEGKIYYRQMGDLNTPPFIKLLGDSQVAGEEIVKISRHDKVKYILIAAYSAMSNGIGSFFSYKARALIDNGQGQEVTSCLAHKDPFSYWVALALIDFTKPGELSVQNVEAYSNKKNFEIQFHDRVGEKPSGWIGTATKDVMGVKKYDPERSPHLFRDGSFMMSVGVREFK